MKRRMICLAVMLLAGAMLLGGCALFPRASGRPELVFSPMSSPLPAPAQTPGAADPFVAVQKLSESSVNLIIRAWVKGSDYWPAQFDLNERIYTELPQAGIRFPFPQLDVHVHPSE